MKQAEILREMVIVRCPYCKLKCTITLLNKEGMDYETDNCPDCGKEFKLYPWVVEDLTLETPPVERK